MLEIPKLSKYVPENEFLRADMISENETEVEVVATGEIQTQNYGVKPYLDVACPDGEIRRLLLNKTTIRNLLKMGVEDTEELVGTTVVLEKVKVTVRGQLKEILVITKILMVRAPPLLPEPNSKIKAWLTGKIY